MENRTDQIGRALLLGGIGDSVASAYEHSGRALTHLEVRQISDDTQLTLSTLRAVNERATVDNIAEHLRRDFVANRYSGLGSTTLGALRALSTGAPWYLSGLSGEFAKGAGAAMRIAPLVSVADPTTIEGRSLIRDVAQITHRTDEAYAGALAIPLAIHYALSGKLNLDQITVPLFDSNIRDRILALDRTDATTVKEVVSTVGNGGVAWQAVPCAIGCAMLCRDLPLEHVWRELISAGGDCDTIASMTGQNCGALGYDVDQRLEREFREMHPSAFKALTGEDC